MAKALLILEDSTLFKGEFFGSEKEVFGEVVFNTGMTGYQEALTDPSYAGQILTMTYPLIGNYGINNEDFESEKIQVRGFVVSELCKEPSHFKSKKTLDFFLKEFDIPGISGIDTRALTRIIRNYGTMCGMICSDEVNVKKTIEEIKKTPFPDSIDLIPGVTRKKIQTYNKGGNLKVVLIDCGVKENIIRCLVKRNCEVLVAPAKTSAQEILNLKPNGVLVSNGPGNPAKPLYVIETIKNLFGKIPMFGICLGHQMFGLAAGAKTYKLKFGHRGLNHPVKDLERGRVHITTQNHGYAVDAKSLEGTGFKVSHVNLNDGSVEGMEHEKLPIFSVQYHPEASPGPRDNEYLFDTFVENMKKWS